MKFKTHTLSVFLFCLTTSPLVAENDLRLERTRLSIMMHERHMQQLSNAYVRSHTQTLDIGNIAVITADKLTLVSPNRFDLAVKNFPSHGISRMATT